MPRCEGLSDCPCPKKVNNRSVKLTQGDLMLCPHCDEIRFPTSTAAVNTLHSTDTTASNGPELRKLHSLPGGRKVNSSISKDAVAINRSETKKSLKTVDSESEDNSCIACLEPTEDGITCDICKHTYHQECCGLSKDVFDALKKLIDQTGWVCIDCRTASSSQNCKLQAAVVRLTEQLADVHVSLAFMQGEIDELKLKRTSRADTVTETKNVTVTRSTTATDLAASSQSNITANVSEHGMHNNEGVSHVSYEVHRALSDITRRKKNVVVCGLPESQGDNDRALHDEAAFSRLCEEHLSVKPSLSHKGCKRLGKLIDGNHQPRRLLVHLTSEENASNVLLAAKRLRHSDEPFIAESVYINPDMSPAEAKLAFEKRAKRRAQARNTRTGSGSITTCATSEVMEAAKSVKTTTTSLTAVNSLSSMLSGSLIPSTSSSSPSSTDCTQNGITDGAADSCDPAMNKTDNTARIQNGGSSSALSVHSKQFVPDAVALASLCVDNI